MTTKSNFLRFLAFMLLAVSILGCHHSSAPSSPNSPRDYTWDATNLSSSTIPSPVMWSIWGTSRDNLYIAGEGLGDGRGTIFRFDGKTWSPQTVTLGSSTFFALRQIFGFSPSDIWAVGGKRFSSPATRDSALVLHYDGATWTSVLSSHMGVSALCCVWGTSSSNLYCGSVDGKIMHYDGSRWTAQILHAGLSFNSIGGDADRIFASGNTFRGTGDDSTLCFSKGSSDWAAITLPSYANVIMGFYTPARSTYYAASYGLYQWKAERWQPLLQGNAFFTGMAGIGTDNVLAVGYMYPTPLIFHWNGIDWSQLSFDVNLVPSGLLPEAAWTDGNEAFVVGNNSVSTFVLHGK